MLIPEPLQPGDRIRVVAPSSPFDRTLVLRALGWLGKRYRVQVDWKLFSRSGLFAGDDEHRTAALSRALSEPGIRAVIAARGGHGLLRIVHRLDLEPLRHSPRWVVGFSDVTALHLELGRIGIASLHGPMATALGRGDAGTRARFVESLEDPLTARRYTGLEPWHPGRARGPLAGGNLTVLFSCAAAGRLELPPGCVLLLEDVTETSYRIDRMLSALLLSGALRQAAAVALGEFVDCPAGPHGVAARDVLRERLTGLGVPVVAGLPVGHGPRNHPLHLGFTADVDGATGTFSIAPPTPDR